MLLQIVSVIFLTFVSLVVLLCILVLIPLIFGWCIFAGIRAVVSKKHRALIFNEYDQEVYEAEWKDVKDEHKDLVSRV